ncbi:sulfite exporter TauE/SafE family protein [Pelosinus sp. IPA-1]|uniref:sulfite exporter TauE/SafE family protein n=1 Tax=Pelosinus sp. IPA-1 TaxID=3029569 RepID=UPI0024361880|nr:sulfite exporter TauE/SafE family protein [Pelosinus sp. IPA-1]GMA98949.1 anion permease [Pelosinus sp. IPA-1]
MDLISSNIFLIVLFSSFIQSITGFGFAVVGTPLLLFFMEPKQVVSLMVFGALILNLMVIYKTRGKSDPKVIWPMFIASLIGIVPGVYILKVVDASNLKLCIGILILLVSLFMASNYVMTIKREKLATVLVGIVSGFMGGATSLSGPPVALFLMNQQQDKEAFRANLVRYFCLGNIATLLVMYFMETMELGVLRQGLYAIPGVLLGVWVGEKAFAKVSPKLFKWITLGVIFFCGTISVTSELIKR